MEFSIVYIFIGLFAILSYNGIKVLSQSFYGTRTTHKSNDIA